MADVLNISFQIFQSTERNATSTPSTEMIKSSMLKYVYNVDDNIEKIYCPNSSKDNMFSKSGCKFNGTTKVQYTNQFDDLIDLGMIRNVYINEEELVEIK